MTTKQLKENLLAFLEKYNLEIYENSKVRGVKYGGVNITIEHQYKLSTKDLGEFASKEFAVKMRWGAGDIFSNLTVYEGKGLLLAAPRPFS
jgi:hypothetical protein